MPKLTTKAVCKKVQSLDGVTEKDHFGSDAFYANKRIFATVWHDKNEVNLRLSPEEQRHFLVQDGEGFVEIDNAWGRQGWTTVHLEFVDPELFEEALHSAWKRSSQATKKSKSKTAVKKRRPSK